MCELDVHDVSTSTIKYPIFFLVELFDGCLVVFWWWFGGGFQHLVIKIAIKVQFSKKMPAHHILTFLKFSLAHRFKIIWWRWVVYYET